MSFLHPSDLPIPPAIGARRGLAPVSGLIGDTPVLTRCGFVPARNIRAGDAVVTREHGLQPVERVAVHTARTRMVRFESEVLSNPELYPPLRLPAHQQITLRDWRAKVIFGKPEAKTSAAALIDDAYVTDDGLDEPTLIQLWLPRSHTLYVGGMEVCSAHGFDGQLRPAF